MNTQAGLSFDQAPPLWVPLLFVLTAPLFLLAAALLLLFAPEAAGSRWAPQVLALTHALTLGFLAMAMVGAMMQMLPVVTGSVVPAATTVAWLVHVPLCAGTVALMAGFLGAGAGCFAAGATLLAIGFAAFLVAAGFSLARAVTNPTVGGMRLAVLSLASTAVLGVVLALPRAGFVLPVAQPSISEAHVVFGFLGWILLLVVGVAYQVVPMFQITPPYPAKMARWLAPALFVLLTAHAVALQLPQGANSRLFTGIGLSAGVLSFAVMTLRLQSRRRRKLPDTTLDFWRMGMASLALCAATWLAGQVWPALGEDSAYALMLGVLFLMGFAASVVNGMLYKIVPFLAWFHLQAQLQARAGTIPNMKQMIAETGTRLHFWLHFAACLLLVAAVMKPGLFAAPAGAAMALSALLLWANLFSAARRFVRHGGALR